MWRLLDEVGFPYDPGEHKPLVNPPQLHGDLRPQDGELPRHHGLLGLNCFTKPLHADTYLRRPAQEKLEKVGTEQANESVPQHM